MPFVSRISSFSAWPSAGTTAFLMSKRLSMKDHRSPVSHRLMMLNACRTAPPPQSTICLISGSRFSHTHRILSSIDLFALYHEYLNDSTIRFLHTPDVFPPIVQSGCIFAGASPIPRKKLRFRASKSRTGTNPIRPNDANLSFYRVASGIIVATTAYSDAPPVHICKKNHPSFASKPGW